MRKSRENLYTIIVINLVFLLFLLSFTLFKEETALVKAIYKENMFFSIFTSVSIFLIITFTGIMKYEEGRKRGIEEMAKEVGVELENWPEKIVVCKKHTFNNERKISEVSIRYDS